MIIFEILNLFLIVSNFLVMRLFQLIKFLTNAWFLSNLLHKLNPHNLQIRLKKLIAIILQKRGTVKITVIHKLLTVIEREIDGLFRVNIETVLGRRLLRVARYVRVDMTRGKRITLVHGVLPWNADNLFSQIDYCELLLSADVKLGD